MKADIMEMFRYHLHVEQNYKHYTRMVGKGTFYDDGIKRG